jgi:hypothetical protein
VDVGPLVIPHPEAAKLTEPGKGALDDPPPPAQATPWRGAAHGQEGHDVTNPETAPNRRRVVAPTGRRECRSDTRDRRRAAVRPLADGVEWEGTVRRDPTTDRGAARRPYLFTLLCR